LDSVQQLPPIHSLSLGVDGSPQTSSTNPPRALVNNTTASPTVSSDVDWFYLDPQGNVQGAFSREDMREWQSSGYFAATLMLRRTVDQRFVPLGDMAKLYGRNPFEPAAPHFQPPPPPLLDNAKELEGERACMKLHFEFGSFNLFLAFISRTKAP
jgi:hypothetical protein